MRGSGTRYEGRSGEGRGSIVILTLFACLGVAVVIQVLAAVVLCGERALSDEAIGRVRLDEKDRGLAALRQRALTEWKALPWTQVVDEGGRVEGALFEAPEASEWIMEGRVRQAASVSQMTVTAWLERGRDGLDLPAAPLVADGVTAAAGRTLAWIETETQTEADPGPGDAAEAQTAVAYVGDQPEVPVLGSGCSFALLPNEWRLDAGWAALVSTGSERCVAPRPGVVLLSDRPGHVATIPVEAGGSAVESPLLVVLTGGADLDAEDLGELYGVLVVDDGSVSLEGTTLHGAVFATHEVRLGQTGRVVFSRSVLRWATDGSLQRVRLVPGTRWESTE